MCALILAKFSLSTELARRAIRLDGGRKVVVMVVPTGFLRSRWNDSCAAQIERECIVICFITKSISQRDAIVSQFALFFVLAVLLATSIENANVRVVAMYRYNRNVTRDCSEI